VEESPARRKNKYGVASLRALNLTLRRKVKNPHLPPDVKVAVVEFGSISLPRVFGSSVPPAPVCWERLLDCGTVGKKRQTQVLANQGDPQPYDRVHPKSLIDKFRSSSPFKSFGNRDLDRDFEPKSPRLNCISRGIVMSQKVSRSMIRALGLILRPTS
jgi:hypothetical protein